MIIALVGSPLSGKTTFLKKLQKANIKVFSADTFVNELYKKGHEGYKIIKNELGNEFVNDLSVNRRRVAEWASDDDNLKRLNELIHPLIFNYLDGKDGYVAEIPVLSSSPIKFKYDKLVLVKASPEKIHERFKKTKLRNPEFIKKIIEGWEIDMEFDLVVDTTNDINNNDIDSIKKLINEK